MMPDGKGHRLAECAVGFDALHLHPPTRRFTSHAFTRWSAIVSIAACYHHQVGDDEWSVSAGCLGSARDVTVST
eukprot:3798116-Rhodomonas_salina.5